MIRWLVVVVVALLLFSNLRRVLERFGFGRLPGDVRFRLFGRDWFLPFASTVVLGALAMLVVRFL